MAETVFRQVIEFFEVLGVYDVILPFLLIFTILFAILDRTRVLGTEKVGDDYHPKKNLNAMVAFIVGFLVVASSKLVAIINEALANLMLLLLIVIFFVILVGVFYEEGKPVILDGPWKAIFSWLMFIGIILVFLWAVKIDSNTSICSSFDTGKCPLAVLVFGFLSQQWNSTLVGSIVLVLIVIFFMWFITGDKKSEHKKES